MKQTALRDRKYLDWLRTQRCILTGAAASDYEAVDPCHIGTRGKGLKSSDDEALPIAHYVHHEMHNKGEISVLRERAPDDVLRAAFRALARERYKSYLKGEPNA